MKEKYLAFNRLYEETGDKPFEGKDSLLSLYQYIFDHVYNWVVVVDAEGYIAMINKPYCEFIGIPQEEAIGRHVTEVIENTRMHIVVETGHREIGDIQKIKGNNMIADRIPIFQNGKIIGAVGTVIFKDMLELDAYVSKIMKMESQIAYYKEELKKITGGNYTFKSIVGNSEKIRRAKELAQKVSSSKSNVLLLGESGTGKELFAHAIHNASSRGDLPLVKINCGAIPSELLESELFGYEQGAFTGAKKGGKPGKFEMANKSTIFLDEIGDLPLNMQVKILRVIQEREVERIGGLKPSSIDVRIIAATNRDLSEMVRKKLFREDLYYRLNVVNIQIPPLRERKEDVSLLSNYLMRKLAKEMNCHVTAISPKAMEALVRYNWPGNIRELANIIERAINFIDKEASILLDHLPFYIRKELSNDDADNPYQLGSLKEIIEEVEKNSIIKALKETDNNKYKAAKILQISRTSLYEKMKRYSLEL
ncbi:AAA family ATPase [Alkaliphilus serpentinus]|uniref:AAA family ATPase n=1 Tax=Alkaliphilus serpentinus TaxID=1482731 RepID=A0A833HRR2_9FIRM|nr:AAA family ATPase [Alkaliphilus serpentinus]